MSHPILELAVDSIECSIAAEKGGAARVELCGDLLEGGLTPTAGMIAETRKRTTLGLFVMIRPCAGPFCYTEYEFAVMEHDVLEAKRLGADGAVFGVLKPDRSVDTERCRRLIELARPMKVTFHRAFDVVRDPFEALETLMELGVNRILTSGQRPTALEGLGLIKQLLERAGDRLVILPGAGITAANAAEFLRAGAKELHTGSAVKDAESEEVFPNGIRFGTKSRVNPDKVKRLIDLMAQARRGV